MSEQLKVGVIGAGNMGGHHIRNYSEMPETQLVAISDPETAHASLAEEHGAVYFKDYRDMLEGSDIEAVSIAVPTYLHHKIASETLKRGIHTLIEKPIAATIEEAEELTSLAEENDTVLTVGHIERYNPVLTELKKMIDNEQLGTISSIISQRIGGFPRNEPETDVVQDLAIHDIDIIRYLMGAEGELLSAHGTSTFHNSETDSAEILMRFNGASGFIQANWVSPVKIRKISVSGSRGYVEANYITQDITFYEHMAIRKQDNFEEFVKLLGKPVTHEIHPYREEPLRRELGAFASAAVGITPDMLVSPNEATSALKIALQAAESLHGASKHA